MTLADYRDKIRLRISDTPEANRLLRDKESSDSQLEFALNKAIERFNGKIPYTVYTIETFPRPYFLIESAIIELLISSGILYSRNSLTYNDGSLSINDFEDKDERYLRWINLFLQRVIQEEEDWKRQLNIKKGYGSLPSPYKSVG